MITEERAALLRRRLGKAARLVDNDQYLPMFRNRQVCHAKIFKFSVELAKKKHSPKAYFATIWSKGNLEKTLDWLSKMMARARARAAEERRKMMARARADSERVSYSAEGRAKLAELKHGLWLLA